ncbi:MAG: fasciclin domain-containing protein, partial [Bacteroidaceae bacterium]|nr:fasciclin domain-containing protein [Bacteroidaceae bacterium]
MKTIKNFKFLAIMAFAISALQVSFVSCSDDPGAENYYTSTSEYASDFLRNREKFSKFVKVVEQSNKMHLLSTYGQYTVFAPTNEAFDL